MRKYLLYVLLPVLLVTNSTALFSADLSQFSSKLNEITDVKLQTTLKNSILAGLIETQADFDEVVSRAEVAANSNSSIYYSAYNRAADTSSIGSKITSLANPLKKLDRDAVKVVKNEKNDTKYLFQNISGTLPASYKATIDFCNTFNPKVNTNEYKRNPKAVDAYFNKIKDDPCIQYALSVTNTTLVQMRENWFGNGDGFEHVIAGELKGSSVSGYHWWYKFYTDERKGNAEAVTALGGLGNPRIYTGKFFWDPDGDGPLPRALKPKGGFSIANSAQALIALGHIAFETMKKNNGGKVFSALKFNADINGETFAWQMYTLHGSIRSLYPIASNSPSKIYYELEEQLELDY
jgi:hypothetical protein